ncbi:MAG: transposase [Planctomyces sp.]
MHRRQVTGVMACPALFSTFCGLHFMAWMPSSHLSRFTGARGEGRSVDSGSIADNWQQSGSGVLYFQPLGGGQRDWRGAGVRYCTHKITNAVAKGMNSKIMLIKRHAGGFRNRENFKTAIFFHCGVLSLDPQ